MKKTNKLISILLVLAMLLSMVPMTVFAADNLTDPTTSVTLKDADGNGLYEIGTAAELYAFANLVNAGNVSVSVELTADITLNKNVLKEDGTLNGDGTNFTPWVPIGGEENKFAGVFDGKKHTISGLYYNGTDTYVGLFGSVDGKYKSETIGVIKNIAIVDSYLKTTISGYNIWVRVGGIAGFASSHSRFQNCFVEATLEVDNSKDCKLCIGGIAGMTYANAVNCCTDVVINYNDDTMSKSIGGILASVTNGSLVNCHTNYSTLGEYNTGTEVTGCSTNVTDEQFASGEITYLLNGSKADLDSVWKQTLGEDNYPSFNGKYVDSDESKGYYNLAHMHSFEYSAYGDTITATCTAEDCYLNNADGGTLKISAPADLYVDGTTAKEAVIDNQLVENVDYTVTYSAPYGLPPQDAGTYTASVTVGGATASVQFTLLNYAAKVTDKDGNKLEGSPYKTFAKAISAAEDCEGSTVTLLDDITLTSMLEIVSGKFILDLTGKTIINPDGIEIGSTAELTIVDSASGGKISGDMFGIFNDGSLTVNGGVIEASCAVYNYGTVTVDGGNIQGYITNNGALIVNDGILTRIKNPNTSYTAIVEINGGTFTDFNTIENNDGDITVKGGIYPNGFSVTNDGNLEYTANSILAEGYYYKDANGKLIAVSDDAKKIDGYAKVTKGADLSDAVITLDNTEFTYNGGEIRPTVLVTVSSKALAEGKDYTVSYANNVNAGTATVTVTAVADGNYSGEATADFTIAKKPVTVTATAPDKVYDGTTDILEYSKVIVKFDGAVEGEMLGFTVGKAWYDTADAGTDKTVHIIYAPVASNSIDNYEFPMNPEYSTDNCYVTATADITKKAVTVSATVPDRIYGDDYRVDTSKVVITFDGIVEGDDAGYVVTDAYYHAHTITDSAPVQVVYNVNGADAENYKFPEFGDWIAPNYGVQATGRVIPRDIANAEITLGDALVYNGAEQTQTVTAVTVDGLEVTYTVSGNKATNVGVYELTITGNGNFAGTKTALYEIAPDTTPVDDLTVDNVKSSDKEDIEAVKAQIENAVTDLADDETKAEYDAISDKCDKLLDKIDETEEKLEEIKGIENNFNPENVSSDDKAAIEDKIAEIEKVNPDNLTDDQKAEYDEIKAGFEALLEEIAAAEKTVAEIGVELEMFDEKRVTKFWEDDIEALKARIDELLTDENMGEAEKAKLNEYKAQCDNLIEIINTPKEYFSLRLFYFIWDCLTWKYNGILWLFSKIFG